MSDVWAVALAAAVASGALLARPFPVIAAGVLAAVGLAVRRPALLCLGAALLASGLAARAWSGLEPPEVGPVRGEVTLVSDPERRFGEVRAIARLAGRRVQIHARGGSAGVLGERLAGERVEVTGRLRPLSAGAARVLERKHVGARLDIDSTGRWYEGGPLTRLANTSRRTLAAGARSLPADHQSLLAGFLLGDDRDQSVEVREDFRGAGLAHLLAVSGQNVAYVLALVAPLLSRLGLRGRLIASVAVLAAFGVLTRWEPSVLRATAMAALTVVSATVGRPMSTLRTVALAVAALLLVDPLLVGSLGFLLSVGACTGIALLGGPLARRLPGPRPVAEALALTLAAQAGVAPVILPVFGELPVASVPANLLAAPAAAPVTVWGIAAGLPAGLVGGTAATVLHLPTRLLLGWVAGVARWGASLPLGHVGLRHVVVLAGATLVVVIRARARRRRAPGVPAAAAAAGKTLPQGVHGVVGASDLAGVPGSRQPAAGLGVAVVVAVTLLTPAAVDVVVHPSPAAGRLLVEGAELWRSGRSVVVVVDQPDPARLLRALRMERVGRIDLVVARRGGIPAARSLEPVLARVPVGMVAAHEGHAVPGAVAIGPGDRVRVGQLAVEVRSAGRALDLDVTSNRRPAARR